MLASRPPLRRMRTASSLPMVMATIHSRTVASGTSPPCLLKYPSNRVLIPRLPTYGNSGHHKELIRHFVGDRGDGHLPISGRLGANRWEPDTSTSGRIAVHGARHRVPARKLRAWHQPAPEVITGRQSSRQSRYRVCEGRLLVSIATVSLTKLAYGVRLSRGGLGRHRSGER